MKRIAPELLATIRETHGFGELTWTVSLPIGDDREFPVLALPAAKLTYATDRGYPLKLAARTADGFARPLLFVQIESFALADHGSAGWAIPTRYTPQTDEERIAYELGFDEGWEDAAMECMFVCDERFAPFWRAARERGRFGLMVEGGESLYPVTIGDREREPLATVLKKWPS